MKKQLFKKAAAFFLSAAMAAGLLAAVPADEASAVSSGRKAMYRLFNPATGEHFYTAGTGERDFLSQNGWKLEGIGWYAPKTSDSPVYRLSNKINGDHHYTMSRKESDYLSTHGWNYEGIGWYSDDAKTTPLYREFNPRASVTIGDRASVGAHNYTTDLNEHRVLTTKYGWDDEGIAWYGLEPRTEDSWKSAYSSFVSNYNEAGSVKGNTVSGVKYNLLSTGYSDLAPILMVDRTAGSGTHYISLFIYDGTGVQPVNSISDVSTTLKSDKDIIYFVSSDGRIIVYSEGQYSNGQKYERVRCYRLQLTGAKKLDQNASDYYIADDYWYEYDYAPASGTTPVRESGYYMIYDNGTVKKLTKSEYDSKIKAFKGSGKDVTENESNKSRIITVIALPTGEKEEDEELPRGNVELEDPTDFGNLKKGDVVKFGSYEQDNNLSNGKEPIEWIVAGKRDGHTLLLSRYALDCKRYNEEGGEITWENCTLRKWLNNDFYNTAFSSSDKAKILTAHNQNPDSYELYEPMNSFFIYGAEGGNATDDKVFFLSWTEARDYFGGKLYDYSLESNYNQKLLCRPTAYAKAQAILTYPDRDNYYPTDTAGCCRWWLRSPGRDQFSAAGVTNDGALGSYYSEISSLYGVRPALLVD